MIIEITNVEKSIRGITILDQINLRFESGNIYGIIGKNGSGKTMLLRVIAGLIYPTVGQVAVDGSIMGKDISFPPDAGILIEKPEFLNHLTGLENLKFLAEIRRITPEQKIKDFMRIFELDPTSTKTMRKYSLGMKQKIGIIQAIMESQQLLILDEAFNALDEKSVATLREILVGFKAEGKLIIITSHNREDIEAICDYSYKIENGKIVS